MYANDSFYTLSELARIGLVAVSAVMALGVITLAVVLMRGRRGSVRLAIGVFLFSIFVWISPQGYYSYYQLILEGLPQQWVIAAPPTFIDLLELVSFRGPQTISSHSLGALFWVLVWLAWWLKPKGSTAPDPDP